jgi:hypothetical protein
MDRCQLALIALTALMCTHCTTSPLDGQLLQSHTAPVLFEGLVPWPNRSVSIQGRKGDTGACGTLGSWQTLTTATSAATPAHVDACGVPWFKWSKSVSLPQDRTYWCSIHGFVDEFEARVQVTGTDMILASFGSDVTSWCSVPSGCGGDAINLCGNDDGITALHCVPSAGCN